MKLPESIQMSMLMHGSRAQGGYIYIYGNREHGVYHTADRKTRREHESQHFEYEGLPGQTFKTFKELADAALSVTEEQLTAERAKWPKLKSVKKVQPLKSGYINGCRLCPREPKVPDTHRVHIAVDCIGVNDWNVGLCDEHLKLTEDVPALVAALEAEVAMRKARADSRKGGGIDMDNLPF